MCPIYFRHTENSWKQRTRFGRRRAKEMTTDEGRAEEVGRMVAGGSNAGRPEEEHVVC